MNKEAKVVWDYLKENLDKQVLIYSRLVELLRKENQSLINRNHQEIIEISAQKELLSPEISELQKEMVSIMKKIVVTSNNERINLQQVIDFAPDFYKHQYLRIKTILHSLKKDLFGFSFRNQKLIENALMYFQHMMNKVMDICSDNQQVYCQKGNTGLLGNNRNFMDIVA